MAEAHAAPDFDALVGSIAALQGRIARDHATIGADETRTRMVIVDPLLKALGWDTADPAMVVSEYRVEGGGGTADYALLKAMTQGARRLRPSSKPSV